MSLKNSFEIGPVKIGQQRKLESKNFLPTSLFLFMEKRRMEASKNQRKGISSRTVQKGNNLVYAYSSPFFCNWSTYGGTLAKRLYPIIYRLALV